MKTSTTKISNLLTTLLFALGLSGCFGVANPAGEDTTTPNSGPHRSVSSVSVGSNHACAVVEGQAFCWGANDHGQLGNNSNLSSSSPVPIDEVNGELNGKVTEVLAGDGMSCAISEGVAYCWGKNDAGQAGNSSSGSSVPLPRRVRGLPSGVTSLRLTTQARTCALANGEVYCWGFLPTDHGLIPSLNPTKVEGLPSGVTEIAAGDRHACALVDGEVWCWGNNGNGQLGTGDTNSAFDAPVRAQTLPAGVTSIAANGATTCAIVNGGAQCFGFISNSNIVSANATQIRGWETGVTAISMENDFCAIVDGGAQCLSHGFGTPPSGVAVRGLNSGVTSIAAGVNLISGGGQDCAVANGVVKCWESDADFVFADLSEISFP